MAMVATQATAAQVARLDPAAIAGYLQDVLGQRLAAVVAGVGDAKIVGKWASARHRPRPEHARRLRDAYQVVQLLAAVEDAETVRAWFTGMNPDLGDRAPARAIADDPTAVMQAARAFLAHG